MWVGEDRIKFCSSSTRIRPSSHRSSLMIIIITAVISLDRYLTDKDGQLAL